jgi:hypothetical protein
MKTNFIKKIIIAIAFTVAFNVIFPISFVLAAPRTNPFTPGQTLDPGAELTEPCGPTDSNCFVAVLGVDDEGSALTGNVLRFNFVGAGVTATNTSGTITVTIPGGPSGLSNGTILIGNASNIPTEQSITGDASLSNAGVLTIANSAVTLAKLAADAVNSAKIIDGSIALADLADNSVDSAKIVDATITNADISATAAIIYSKLALNNSIVLTDLTTDSVNSTKIIDGSIVAADLATDAVTSAKVLDGTLTDNDISATAAISLSKLASGTSGQIIVANAGGVPVYVVVSGDATIDNTGALTIANLAITNAKLAADAVTSAKILDGSIALADLAGDSVDSAKIVDDSIVNADINSAANIALSKLASGSSIVTSLAAPSGSNANGGSITSNVLTLSLADGTNPGLVSTGTQTFAGNKTLTGATTFTGNISQTGATTFSTGSGANTLNGNVTISGANTFTTGTGLTTISGDNTTIGNTTLAGYLAIKKGTDFSTVGSTNNAALGNASLIRMTGASAQTITGIAGGSDGKLLTLINTTAFTNSLTNNDPASADGNRIITGTGATLSIPAGASVQLIYDDSGTAATSFWRVVGGTGGSGSSYSSVDITDKPTGGNIGTAAATVDIATNFNINQTTAGQTLSLPNPTNTTTTKGKVITINNVGTANFTIGGVTVPAGSYGSAFVWNGTVWNPINAASNVGASYVHAVIGTNQTTNISVNDHIKFDTITAQYGSDITPVNTTQEGSGGSTVGGFLLKAGKTYRLNGQVNFASGSGSNLDYGWYNVTAGAYIGTTAKNNSANNSDPEVANGFATAIFTPTIDTVVKIKFTAISVTSINKAFADIQVIAGNSPVTGQSVEYVRATQASNQNLGVGTAVNYSANVVGNITNLGSGRFRLSAGKTYSLKAVWAPVDTSDEFGKIQWYNVTTGSYFGTEGNGGDPTNSHSTGAPAAAIITPTVDTDVEVRMTSDNATGSDFTRNWMEIVQLGTTASTGVAFNVLTNAVATGVLDNTNFAQTWNWSTAATETALALNMNALTSGNGLAISSTNTGTTGNLLSVTSASTGAFTDGGVRFNFTGAHTGNGVQVDSATLTGNAFAINANSLTTGSALSITSSYGAGNSTNGLLRVANTSAVTNGVIFRAQSNSTTGSGLTVLANGNVGIGTSSPTYGFDMSKSSSGSWIARFVNSANTANDGVLMLNACSTTSPSASCDYIRFNSASGGLVADIEGDGAGSVAINTASDERLKTNITQTAYGINTLLQIDVKDFEYLKNPGKSVTGFIAQDLYKIFPNAVSVGSDDVDENGDLIHPWGVYLDHLVPLTVRSIQELNFKLENGMNKVSKEDLAAWTEAGFITSYIDAVKNTDQRDVVEYFTSKMAEGYRFVTDFASERITAIRGYFDKVFAKEVTVEQLCIGTKDNKTCISKDQLDSLLNGQNVAPNPAPTPAPSPTPDTGGTTGNSDVDTGDNADTDNGGNSEPTPEVTE